MKLILLTYPGKMMGEIDTIKELLDKDGLDVLHIRKPGYTKEKVAHYLNYLPKPARERTILTGHPELVIQYHLSGLHHTSATNFISDFPKPQSKSFHSVKEIMDCKHPYAHGYISPVFDSISKTDYPAQFTKEELIALNQKAPFPIYALGGINEKTITGAKEMNFDGVVVLGGIWNQIVTARLYMAFEKMVELK